MDVLNMVFLTIWYIPLTMVERCVRAPLTAGAPVRYPGQRAIRTGTIHRLHTSLESRHQDPHLRGGGGGGMESRNCFALSLQHEGGILTIIPISTKMDANNSSVFLEIRQNRQNGEKIVKKDVKRVKIPIFFR